ncbi:MAG TPA: zf-HC2 domain-containing protein [Blastocatellia bacterium]|nr:zf-HC2 domain-containing protein [Blastocatellia bacterium]
MKQCEDARAQIAFYLDDELKGDELRAFEAHVATCTDCRRLCEDERSFLALVRAARPLYAAPPELRDRVERTLSNAPAPYAASPQLRRRVQRSVWQASANALHFSNGRRPLLLAFVAVFILAAVYLIASRRNAPVNGPSEFALMAVETHQRYVRGQLPLEISSVSPEQISRWFSGKVSFRLELPSYQEASGQEKVYSLEGARLVGFNKEYAAYVAYQMRSRPISLVVTSNSVTLPSGGAEIIMKDITFYNDSIDGYKVMTWSHRGLTYALVSDFEKGDLEKDGLESCIVCHAGTKDRDLFESLKAKGE